MFSAASELQRRLPVPSVGPQLGSDISRQFFGSVVRPADLVVGPHRGEHIHEGAPLVHLHHQRLAEEQHPATVEIYHRTAVGPRRVAPLVLLASPQRGGVPQREFRSADQRVEHAAASPVRVIELPVLVLDDDEVRPVAHVSPISDDAISARASLRRVSVGHPTDCGVNWMAQWQAVNNFESVPALGHRRSGLRVAPRTIPRSACFDCFNEPAGRRLSA